MLLMQLLQIKLLQMQLLQTKFTANAIAASVNAANAIAAKKIDANAILANAIPANATPANINAANTIQYRCNANAGGVSANAATYAGPKNLGTVNVSAPANANASEFTCSNCICGIYTFSNRICSEFRLQQLHLQ